MNLLTLILLSLWTSVTIFWSILWALILGFTLSAIIMAFISKKKVTSRLGGSGPKEIGFAMLLGALSSSCSYAAASMTRSLFQKGTHIVTALAFLLASTNLVIEMSLILGLMLGWQFVVAEFLGGFVLVGIMSLLAKVFLPFNEFESLRNTDEIESRENEDLYSPKTLSGWQAVARGFVSEWSMLWKDILLGIMVSGFLMVFVPDKFWQTLFLRGQGSTSREIIRLIENALIGPLVSVISFVCSIGNIPMAGALYCSGIGFGGALSFIYADLIIIPLILVYKKYFGTRLAIRITSLFYVSMVLAGIIVELIFRILGWVPEKIFVPVNHSHGFQFNYTFYLNLIFIFVALSLILLSRSGVKPQSEAHCCH